MFVTKALLNRLADKFDKWAKEFDKNIQAPGIESKVYASFTASALAYKTAAEELRKLIRDS